MVVMQVVDSNLQTYTFVLVILKITYICQFADKLQDVQKAALIKHPDSPGQIVYTKCDVTQRESVCDLVKEAEEQLGDTLTLLLCRCNVLYRNEEWISRSVGAYC